jgi:hypothetical protein
MSRLAIRALLVAGLVGVGWVVGRAQSVSPDFELMVSAPKGDAQVTCLRGCTLTWAPTVVPANGPVDILMPQATLRGTVATSGTQTCLTPGWSSQCRIWGYTKR